MRPSEHSDAMVGRIVDGSSRHNPVHLPRDLGDRSPKTVHVPHVSAFVKAVKVMVGDVIGEAGKGALDYYRFPGARHSWGGSFNGQLKRLALFDAIVEVKRPVAIIETGTFRGTTTRQLARTGVPVYTIEQNARNVGFATVQLRSHANVKLIQDDSRKGLEDIIRGTLRDECTQPIFCYLDAHWEEDLPLLGELEIIFGTLEHPIVMIDDFEVPGDPGYFFDDYGHAGVLTQSYIEPVVRGRDIALLYPTTPSSAESGARRGCCMLCRRVDVPALIGTGLLREVHFE